MDIEFWAARVQSAKHLSAMQSSRLSAGMNSTCEEKKTQFSVISFFFFVICVLHSKIRYVFV